MSYTVDMFLPLKPYETICSPRMISLPADHFTSTPIFKNSREKTISKPPKKIPKLVTSEFKFDD